MNLSRTLKKVLKLAGIFILIGFPLLSFGLPEDRNQAITILSDSAERDEIKGTTIYAGNVLMEQGSMRINAQKVIIYNTKDKVTKIVATGTPVRYQQKPSENQDLVIAQANRLEYNIVNGTLHLIEHAFLEQEGTSISGNRIDYDVKKSVVTAGGDSGKNQRVKMVIPAHALKHEDE